MKQKAFFITFKGLSMKQITQIFLEDESPPLMLLATKLSGLVFGSETLDIRKGVKRLQ